MKVINAKKLIASTLIFLFSSFHQPLLADSVANTHQEQIARIESTNIAFTEPHIVHVNHESFVVRTPKAGPAQLIELYGATAFPNELLVESGPYTNLDAGFVWFGQASQNPLEQALGDRLLALTPQFYPKIISSPEYLSTIFLLPSLKIGQGELCMLFLGYMLFTNYLAFRGYRQMKGSEIHTCIDPERPIVSVIIQQLAANLAQIDKLIFHTEDTTPIEQAKQFIEQHRQKSVYETLADLLR